MPRKINPQEHWITGKEATAILRRNSGRDDIADSYIRSLARSGKVASRALDRRTNVYRLSDVENYKVERRDQGKGRGKKEEKAVACLGKQCEEFEGTLIACPAKIVHA